MAGRWDSLFDDPDAARRVIEGELERYSTELAARPRLLVATKCETPEAHERAAALERAAKIWPQNPGVKDFATQVVSRQDTMAQMVPQFDRLFAEAKWRDIYNKKLEYLEALQTPMI